MTIGRTVCQPGRLDERGLSYQAYYYHYYYNGIVKL